VETVDTKNEADWRQKGQRVGAPEEGLKEDSVDVDPLESFIAKETAQHAVTLGALMEQAKLSPQQRKIVVLLINEEGLLYPNGDIAAEEVGARLGIPANQTSVQWRRVRKRCSQLPASNKHPTKNLKILPHLCSYSLPFHS